jgi:hypothetical protein
VWEGVTIPDLIHYRLQDGPHASEPTTQRSEIERLARECRATACRAGLDSTVVETRFNVVRSLVPDVVTTARRLRDYLPPVDHRPAWVDRQESGEQLQRRAAPPRASAALSGSGFIAVSPH